MSLSLFGIILGLVLLMFLAYKGYSIIWVAPVCAVVVAVLSGYAILDAYIGDYMKGMADYVLQWFPAFFLGAVYGKVMDLTGSARSLGNALVKLIGPRFAVAAVVIPCLLMTYGGISLFVVVFVIYPMGYSIYRAADLPRTLLPGAIATGAFGITMTAVPGTPQIQNLIPTDYYGTTTMAAPLLSLVACAVMLLPAYIYLEWRVPVPPQGPALCPRPQAQGSGSRLQGSALLALGHRHRPPGGRCAHAQPVPLAAQSLCRH